MLFGHTWVIPQQFVIESRHALRVNICCKGLAEALYKNLSLFVFISLFFSPGSHNTNNMNLTESYSQTLERAISVVRKNKSSYIGMAVLCVVLQQIYASFTVPPKYLRRFPKVSFVELLKSFYKKESVLNRNKRLVTPLTNAGHGFYIVSRTACTCWLY